MKKQYTDFLCDKDHELYSDGDYEVYLAADVDARIAELEKALAQIAIGADGDAVNEDDAFTYQEIEQIALNGARQASDSDAQPTIEQ